VNGPLTLGLVLLLGVSITAAWVAADSLCDYVVLVSSRHRRQRRLRQQARSAAVHPLRSSHPLCEPRRVA
jgi:hypothetical protein